MSNFDILIIRLEMFLARPWVRALMLVIGFALGVALVATTTGCVGAVWTYENGPRGPERLEFFRVEPPGGDDCEAAKDG